MELTSELKTFFTEAANELQGRARRFFQAQVVKLLGKGVQRRAAEELEWNRGTIRKGMHELASGIRCEDDFSARGRKPTEVHLPNLLQDIKAIMDAQSQTDPTFKTTRLYARVSAKAVREQLIKQKGYSAEVLPCEETIRVKINQLGYRLRSVQKSRPKKKLPETDAIFEQLDKLHQETAQDKTILRLSLDAKATVLIGQLSRGGKTRVIVKALDHDFQPDEKLTPFGILLPQYDELYLYMIKSRLTSDCIVDCLHDLWLTVGERFPYVKTLLLNQDNGPENHSRRTQFMKRITEFADEFQIAVQLAYFPPLSQQVQSHRTGLGSDGKQLEWQSVGYD